MSDFVSRYREKFTQSAVLFDRALQSFPSGVNHDGKHMSPYPLTFTSGEGGIKHDADGNETIDFVMGHGALLLGHNHPAITSAISEQAQQGTHLAGNNARELEWGELVRELVPSAEKIRFVQSGTEATMLALRVARAHTQRKRFLRFYGHFHGWHDYVLLGNRVPFDLPTSKGIPEETLSTATALPTHDAGRVRRELERGDVAAVIVEPGGGTQGKLPADPGWVSELRELTREFGAILIFDEVVSGFRASPGGVQAHIGVTPDLTTLAKALSGGLPGGALCGSAKVMGCLSFDSEHKVAHPGTFNANPLSAAAGVACLSIVRDGVPQARANALAARLRTGMNAAFEASGVAGRAYGSDSTFHIHLGEDLSEAGLLVGGARAASKLRARLLYHGVDILGPHGWVSSEHTEKQVDAAILALAKTLEEIKENMSEGAA